MSAAPLPTVFESLGLQISSCQSS